MTLGHDYYSPSVPMRISIPQHDGSYLVVYIPRMSRASWDFFMEQLNLFEGAIVDDDEYEDDDDGGGDGDG